MLVPGLCWSLYCLVSCLPGLSGGVSGWLVLLQLRVSLSCGLGGLSSLAPEALRFRVGPWFGLQPCSLWGVRPSGILVSGSFPVLFCLVGVWLSGPPGWCFILLGAGFCWVCGPAGSEGLMGRHSWGCVPVSPAFLCVPWPLMPLGLLLGSCCGSASRAGYLVVVIWRLWFGACRSFLGPGSPLRGFGVFVLWALWGLGRSGCACALLAGLGLFPFAFSCVIGARSVSVLLPGPVCLPGDAGLVGLCPVGSLGRVLLGLHLLWSAAVRGVGCFGACFPSGALPLGSF